ncbi:hypothetical protein BOTBODRAFT_51276 [Botryobasidium botryosum FD-172 SS1]|uniref:Uncharacterized protein n=1 Tax=Botryobasidium botryosum (strain FD-172 SS1) TaxID=930990 RepID=A0A067MVZ4_BOTB1|nr:hypothetical protein BOTBODRAFT_51276 [Botryobasidium botryosum FD-172 SS1]
MVSLGPTTQLYRTLPLLQPFYYSSSLFVDPVKQDIDNLLTAFTGDYTAGAADAASTVLAKPFPHFKSIWKAQKWDYAHLLVLDPRGRIAFVDTVTRLFLERASVSNPPITRAAAVFGLHAFFFSQPSLSGASLYQHNHISITIDDYESLLALPLSLQAPLSHYVVHILSKIAPHFLILPPSATLPHNPHILPASTVRAIPKDDKPKAGRPSKAATAARAEHNLEALGTWIETTEAQLEYSTAPPLSTLGYIQPTTLFNPLLVPPHPGAYTALKSQLRNTVDAEALKKAEDTTIGKFRAVEQLAITNNFGHGREGVLMVDRAKEREGGLLSLVEGIRDGSLGGGSS